MSDDSLDPILEHAKRDQHGNLVMAFLRKTDEDVWDTVVVDANGQPLRFWAPGPSPMSSGFVDEDGNALMILTSTPPGVVPGGLMPMPADAAGSAVGTIVSIVTRDSHTEVQAPRDEDAKRPVPPLGPTAFDSITSALAARSDDGFYTRDVATADGGVATVMLNWDGNQLLFWLNSPGDEATLELFAVAFLPNNGGLVAVAVDDSLRPIHSGTALEARLKD